MQQNKQNIKVFHIVWGMALGGTENMLVDIINEQIKELDVSIVIIDNNYDEKLLSMLDYRVNRFFLKRLRGKKNIFTIFKLNLLLLCAKPAIIHCHTPSIMRLILLRKIIHAKICATIHATNITTRELPKYHKLFSISMAVQRDIIQRYGVDSRVILNGINFDKINTKETYCSDGYFNIVQVSRLDHEKKGQDLLLNAIHKLIYEHKVIKIKATFIGDGPSMNYLKELAEKLGITAWVSFIGSRSRDYIHETLQNYDLLVQPSYYEGFGLTIVEGLCAKLPVLVPDVEGPMEIIKQGDYGYWFSKGNIDDLAKKIVAIFRNIETPEFHRQVTSRCSYARLRFDIRNTAANYVSEYRELLNS